MENKSKNIEIAFDYIKKYSERKNVENDIDNITWFSKIKEKLENDGYKMYEISESNTKIIQNNIDKKIFDKVLNVLETLKTYIFLIFESKDLREDNSDFCEYISSLLYESRHIAYQIKKILIK